MKNNIKKENKIIRFNRKFYTLQSVKKAVKSYKGITDFKINKKSGWTEVVIKADKEELEKISDEFKNYVLFLNIRFYGFN